MRDFMQEFMYRPTSPAAGICGDFEIWVSKTDKVPPPGHSLVANPLVNPHTINMRVCWPNGQWLDVLKQVKQNWAWWVFGWVTAKLDCMVHPAHLSMCREVKSWSCQLSSILSSEIADVKPSHLPSTFICGDFEIWHFGSPKATSPVCIQCHANRLVILWYLPPTLHSGGSGDLCWLLHKDFLGEGLSS